MINEEKLGVQLTVISRWSWVNDTQLFASVSKSWQMESFNAFTWRPQTQWVCGGLQSSKYWCCCKAVNFKMRTLHTHLQVYAINSVTVTCLCQHPRSVSLIQNQSNHDLWSQPPFLFHSYTAETYKAQTHIVSNYKFKETWLRYSRERDRHLGPFLLLVQV